MKKYLISLVVIFGTFHAHAFELNCKTKYAADLDGANFVISAQWIPGESLEAVNLIANDEVICQNDKGTWVPYSARNPKYKGMDRFIVPNKSAGWSETSLLLPAVLKGSKFVGYFSDQGHDGIGNFALDCVVQ